jgi:AcrR family transcriptional regulator
MRSPDRRAHLLDVATRLVVDDGPTAVTMERLAEAAGVSKALPYKHFDNIEAVFVAVYRREIEIMGTRIWRGLTDAGPDDDLVRVGIGIYFDEIARCGRVLSALSEPGTAIPALSSPGRSAAGFTVDLLRQFHGLDRRQASAVAGMLMGAVAGAAETLRAGFASREEVEPALVDLYARGIERGRSIR